MSKIAQPAPPLAFPADLAARWDIRDAELIADTHTSHVWRAFRTGGTAIVKALKPAGLGELPGMAYLDWLDGHGAVRVLEAVRDTFLIEDAGLRTLGDVVRAGGDDLATDVIAGIVGGLANPAKAPPASLVPLETNFRELFAYPESGGDPALAAFIGWAKVTARDLLADQQDIRPLHGDLHHDNIICDDAGTWRIIDPKGLIGDPAYDVANVFGNPLGATDLILDPARARHLASRFASALDMTEEKILTYAATHAALSICWSSARPGSASAALNISERLAFGQLVRGLIS
ncbi:aminoglycoside phosphotransferase family protein [Rhizobium sp. NRK18]|uniref:aminoglycoside phosphotransferase family protein n=1 Tax=Rhizobium sp. NRK18 TaxID=2964667 RepID=UPI0021C2FD02|nr:aminoglycoside phosphotransferase family protein [Rhizobium sp. NRK18]MCQ2004626.1 phosphotransferase [Rhizobium sp. NRK18]